MASANSKQQPLRLYRYTGSVLDYFGNVIGYLKNVETLAVSENQARNRIAFRYKRDHGLDPKRSVIRLGGHVTLVQ